MFFYNSFLIFKILKNMLGNYGVNIMIIFILIIM